MNAIPSPLERLLQLEQDIQQLQAQQNRSGPALNRVDVVQEGAVPARHPWPVDELLLTRLLRRSPQVLAAYQAPAQIEVTAQRGLLLTVAQTSSVFQFCELTGGDAVVWVQADPPSWVWESETFQQIFQTPMGVEEPQDLVLQFLPVFKPVVRGRQWTLFRPGEMVPSHRPFPEQAEQLTLLSRVETLERLITQQMARQETEIRELRARLTVQQDQLDRLLRISVRQP